MVNLCRGRAGVAVEDGTIVIVRSPVYTPAVKSGQGRLDAYRGGLRGAHAARRWRSP